MTSPHTQHAANRAADLALIAASTPPTCRHATCSIANGARTLLIQQVGDEKTAEQLIAEARAALDEHKA
ncbi:hypothetical protein AB0J43_02680 [Nonomuraea fuscirosea]